MLAGTALLLLPLTYDTLAAGTRALAVFGLQGGSWSALDLGQLLRGANGTFGYGWGGWVLPIVALGGVLIARGVRHEYAVKFLSVLALTLALAVLVGRNWLGPFAPDVNALLVLVGLMVAVLVAVTVSAIETDLVATSPGWPRVVGVVCVVLLVVASLPLLAQTATGRFNLPATGTPESIGNLAPATLGGYRVLWLGEPNVLPVAGWSVAPGLAAATSTDSLPNGSTLFSPPDPGAADDVLHAVNEALNGQTVQLGQLLAPAGISSIVVMSSAAPTLNGLQVSTPNPPPANLLPSLRRQNDLMVAAHSPGVEVFTNTTFHGIIAERSSPLPSTVTSANPDSVVGWTPALDFEARTGTVKAGTVVAGMSPASAFELRVNGKDTPRSVSLSWAPVFDTPAGTATLVLHQLPLNAVFATITLGLWASFLLGFGALEFLASLDKRRTRRRPVARAAAPDAETVP